jgi:hypothetical protein
MNTIILSIAEPIADQDPEPVTIIIDGKLPEFSDLKEAEQYYDHQASALEKGLFNALPQGVMDKVIIRLMARKVSLYRGLST